MTRGIVTPPTADKIAKYRDEDYPEWLELCERVLSRLHKLLERHQSTLEFCFLVENCGIRPAADALITIEAHGNFHVMAPRDSEEDKPIALPLRQKFHAGFSRLRAGAPQVWRACCSQLP